MRPSSVAMAHGELQACLHNLIQTATKTRYYNVQKAHEKTFHWLFDSTKVPFGTWLQGTGAEWDPLFWIKGKPGSGKSTLMKYAINHPMTWQRLRNIEAGDWICVAFFFHDRGSAIQKSIEGMLTEILSTLLQRLPELLFAIEPEYKSLVEAQKNQSPSWSLDSLKSALVNLVQQRQVAFRAISFWMPSTSMPEMMTSWSKYSNHSVT